MPSISFVGGGDKLNCIEFHFFGGRRLKEEIPYLLDKSGFSLDRLHMGGGTSAGDKVLMGGLMRGDIDLMGGGPNFDRLYHKLKVLLMLSCNYTMQFIGYDSIKTR